MENNTAEANSSAQEETSQAPDNSDAPSGENRGASGSFQDDVVSGTETLRQGEVHFATEEVPASATRYGRALTRIIANRSITTTFAHASMGLVLIAVGWAVRALFVFRSDLVRTPASQAGDDARITSAPNTSVDDEHYEYAVLPPSNRLHIYPVSIGTYFCQAITCHPQLSLVCIGVGCVFLFCSCSGGLMVYHKMKEYVCCHLVWVSISALASITFAAACMMGLKTAYEHGRGLVACTCTLIVATILEAIFCGLDIFNVSSYFSPRTMASARERQPGQARVEEGDSTQSANVTSRGGSQHRRQDSRRSENTFIRESSRHAQQRSITIDITQERGRSEQSNTRSSRPRGARDRNLLHPGYQAHARHRGRRRPMLRAQNHYVLVPAPIARSRAHSRSRGLGERRNRNDMPMFVIPNHDRYVRALNQSMETLETGFNRGSVPSDVLPSSPTYADESRTEPKEVGQRGHADTSDMENPPHETEPQAVHSQFNREHHTLISHDKNERESPILKPPLYQIDDDAAADANRAMCIVTERQRASGKEGAVYSVVKRSKDGASENKSGELMCEDMSNGERYSVSMPTSLPFLQTVLADKLSLAASVVLDSDFHEPHVRGSESCRASFVVDAKCPPPPPTPDLLATGMPGALYNTSSEGDFSTISNESTTTPTYDRGFLASVSSDSGLGEHSLGGSVKCSRGKTPRYCNVPLHGSPRVSLELSSLGASSLLFTLPPMAPKTPAYENIDVRPQSAQAEKKEEESAFTFSN